MKYLHFVPRETLRQPMHLSINQAHPKGRASKDNTRNGMSGEGSFCGRIAHGLLEGKNLIQQAKMAKASKLAHGTRERSASSSRETVGSREGGDLKSWFKEEEATDGTEGIGKI